MHVFFKLLKKLNYEPCRQIGVAIGVLCAFCLSGLMSPAHVRADSPPLDLVFVIDNSGSMKKNDPKFITPQVVSTFVQQLPVNSQVAMVLFDSNSHLLMPLTMLSHEQVQKKIADGLKQIDYRGQYTNTPVGIERALYELKTRGRETSIKSIVFITDGIVDTGDPNKDVSLTEWLKNDLTAQSKGLGVRIYGIALTDAADFSLIQTVAARTDGEYYRTYEAAEISEIFKQIQMHLTAVEPTQAAEPVTLPELPKPRETPGVTPQAQAKPISSPTAEAAATVAPETSPASGETAVVVTEKSIWMILLTVVLIVLVLVAALVFFFYQNSRRRVLPSPEAAEEPKLNIPEAYLEDLGNVCGAEEARVVLDKERLTIGRGKSNDIIIAQPSISGFHATIEFRNLSFYLEDQRSTNGTRLNKRRLPANEPVRLKSGDHITLAKFEFKFVVADQKPFGDTMMLSVTALSDPEAEATIVLDLDGSDSKQGLIACTQNHMMQIYGLGAKYREFITTYFAHDTLDIIATAAHENLQRTKSYGEQYCTPIIKNNTFYLVCSLPVPISSAAEWYSTRHHGFTQYIFTWIKSKQYHAGKCMQMCIVTFGQSPATWVSITIVPTHSEPDPVEIMSVDFLNEEEKTSLALDFDNHGRVV
jgi:pSer/pThr/pTyr-binding forkhead associated (FHA) protein/Mg-chelatase subunit ChlD